MKKILLALPVISFVFFFAGCTTPTPIEQAAERQKITPRHVNGSQPIAFRRVIIEVPQGKSIGSFHAGLFRISAGTYNWRRSGGIVGSEEFNQVATDELRNSGFDVLGEENKVFGEDNSYKARYQLGATIRDMTFNAYDPVGGNFSEATVLAEWQLQDAFSREIVFAYTNSGYAKLNGFDPSAVSAAFGDALKKMIATSRLADLVATNAPTAAPATTGTEPISINVARLDQPRSLPEDMDKVMQGVVYIRAGEMLGSGVIVSSDGYVLTAAHVVSGTKEVAVQFKAGLQLNASVVRVDQEQDLALLKLPGTGYQAVQLNLDAPARAGNELYAIGSPLNEDLAFTVTKGVISAYREREGDKAKFIQTDAALNPGNSGGPLLDKSGRVIGIVSHKIIIPGFEGLAFGVPVDVIAKSLGIIWNGGVK